MKEEEEEEVESQRVLDRAKCITCITIQIVLHDDHQSRGGVVGTRATTRRAN